MGKGRRSPWNGPPKSLAEIAVFGCEAVTPTPGGGAGAQPPRERMDFGGPKCRVLSSCAAIGGAQMGGPTWGECAEVEEF